LKASQSAKGRGARRLAAILLTLAELSQKPGRLPTIRSPISFSMAANIRGTMM
jgi:hypothetical protein